jgi:low temperature requirement protein LtrA
MKRMRARAPEEHARVTMLELFFDLVFVFLVTQLTSLVLVSPGAAGYGRALLVLLVTWWMYDGYAWLANNVAPTTTSTRLPMLLAMAGFLVMAIAVPDAFGTARWAFAVGYLVVVLLHAVSFTRSSQGGSATAIRSILPTNVGVALLLLVGAAVGARWGWVAWVVAVLVLTASMLSRRESGFTLRAGHFAERHQLLVIIALGETVIATAVSAQGHLGELDVVGAVLGSMVLISALWWVYFGTGDDERGSVALAALPDAVRTRTALIAYSLGHLGHVAALVLVAVGLHRVVVHPPDRLAALAALTFGGGVALFLLAEVLFRRVLALGTVAVLLGGAAASLASGFVGATSSALLQLVLLVIVVLAVLVATPSDQRTSRRSARPASGR